MTKGESLMSKDVFIRKITSRKFWLALIGFISALLVAFNIADNEITQITSVIMAFGTLISYIFAEGWIDAANLEE